MASKGVKLLVWLSVVGSIAGVAYQLTPHPQQPPQPEKQLEAVQSGSSGSGASRAVSFDNLDASQKSAPSSVLRKTLSGRAKIEGCASRPAGLKVLEPPPSGSRLGGQLALFVARFDPVTLEPTKAVMFNPDASFPLASTYKQSVLWALLRQIDAGQLRWNEKFEVTKANQSLGSFPHDGSSVRQLAERMIQHSDNTATDILHRRIGLEAPQKLADELGLCKTRLLLPTKTWWTAQAGAEPEYFSPYSRLNGAEKFAKASRPFQLEMARKLDARAQSLPADKLRRMLDRYFDGPYYNPQIDEQTQNATTAFEWATLVAHEFLNSGLSVQGDKTLSNIMDLGVGKGYVRSSVPIVKFGGKTGNGWRIFTASGYVQTRAGQHIVYVLLNQASSQTYTVTPGYMRSAYGWIVRGIQTIQADDALEKKALEARVKQQLALVEKPLANLRAAHETVQAYQKLIGISEDAR